VRSDSWIAKQVGHEKNVVLRSEGLGLAGKWWSVHRKNRGCLKVRVELRHLHTEVTLYNSSPQHTHKRTSQLINPHDCEIPY
jgi:hypothetical protein